MRKSIFLLFLFGINQVNAQLVDLMGSLSVQGVLSSQSTQSVNQGLSMLNRNKILQDIQYIIMDIQTRFLGNYNRVNQYSVPNGFLSGVNYLIKSENNNSFYIQLNQIDSGICSDLISSIRYNSMVLNGQNGNKNCVSKNTIKFVFK